MNENPTTPSTSTERTVVVTDNHLARLWILTIASLVLNGVILLLILIGVIVHHHHKKHHENGGDGGRGGCGEEGFRGGWHHHHFHHFGRGGWGREGGFGGGGRFGEEGHGDRGFGQMRGGDRDGGDRDEMRGGGEEGWGKGDHQRGGGMGMDRGGDRGMGMGMGMMNPRGPRTPPDPAKMTDEIVNHLTQKLTLTDDQKAKIKPIVEAQVTQMQKDMEAERQAHEKAFEDTKTKLKSILTADQQKQLDAMPVPGQKPGDADKPAAPATPPGNGT